MNVHPRVFLTGGLFVSLAFFGVSSASAAPHRKLDMIVVSERPVQATADESSRGLPYLAIDGGGAEAGDPVAGERPPNPAQVAAALQAALDARGFVPAADGSTPVLVLVYHWGMIRRDSHEIAPPSELAPNLKARLSLVAPQRLVQDIERTLVAKRYVGTAVPISNLPSHRDALDYARDPRYFVIVSAYRADSLADVEPVRVWRTRLSAATNSGAMSAVIPALLAAGADQLGRDLPRAESSRVSFPEAPVAAPAHETPALGERVRTAIDRIVAHERREFLGNRYTIVDRSIAR
ncbi:hypothetical protein [Opitutus terrae]|uniref:Uncharacterized protein n=1 Tax=Opitutus terrae (strain DSM 11246 / JCM 15787 / PB90-1) TaxID=452637 RepID=B1ZWW4_OPITP|nr:hypothetical protein [Opitutus terrae]ACB75075.1 hypothetical protein Oter_1791 [Opitutus terrae PB90-1]